MPSIQKQSSLALRNLVDDARNHLAALKSLNEPVELWDTLIVPILSRKLDIASLREWEKGATTSDRVTFNKFAVFLEERSLYLESVSVPIQPMKTEIPIGTAGSRKPFRATATVASTPSTCPACGAGHPLFRCDKFKSLSIDEKTKIVQASRSCYNCLQTGHRVQACTRKHCHICNGKHHVLLHREAALQATNISTEEAGPSDSNKITSCVANVDDRSWEHSVLSTAVIYVQNGRGQRLECRALLDSGSQSNFITYELCKRLGISYESTEMQVSGIGGKIKIVRDRVNIKVTSRLNNFNADISCLAIDKITQDMPNISLDKLAISVPAHVRLADPDFDKCRPIDMLIGAGLFWHLLCVGQQRAGTNLLWQKTQLGWILGGTVSWPIQNKSPIQRCHLVTNHDLSNQLEQFWKIENVTIEYKDNIDDCELHFQATTRRDETGRYIVQIPLNEQVGKLGSSRQQAENRLKSLEAKFIRQSQLREEYVKFLNEYEMLGHMSRVPILESDAGLSFYLPHHAVIKEGSTTTKLRVVFDGSAKTSTGISLNDTQRVGSTVQSELIDILLRFRTHKYVLSADIEKMYRQILVKPKKRCLQRILWRPNQDSPIETYELKTVTYGTASAPFLATRVLKQLGLDCAVEAPTVSTIIINDFYVDDLLTGAETMSELVQIKETLSDILGRAGLKLRKWATNSSTFSQHLDIKDKMSSADKNTKTLGLQWLPAKDELCFTTTPSLHKRVTKRTILSQIAQIFDPLGLVSPVITNAKLIMQQLWQLQTNWDESVSQGLYDQWIEFVKELAFLNELKIPRRALIATGKVELVGFSDASEKAYGACVYLRSSIRPGEWESRLLCSKSRVAPLKTITLPRLELCGALLLARLVHKVKSSLRISIDREWYFSDSTITLAWIRGHSSKWKIFVANRVTQIQLVTDKRNWSHVRSHENPADLITRGTTPKLLSTSELWWSGPLWLKNESNLWTQSIEETVDIPEQKKPIISVATVTLANNKIIDRYSDFEQLLRITSYCLRFINNVRKSKTNKVTRSGSSSLSVVELQEAQKTLIRVVQATTFPNESLALSKNQSIPKQSPLQALAPFIDETGIIRVGGRLSNAPITYNKRHPILLPAKHHLTDLIIKGEHNRLLHAGCQQVIASLRENFWPINCTRNVKRVIRGCVRCFRANPRGVQYPMGQLPAARVTPARPFATCGVDYAGPFLTKERSRSKITIKSYICIFICFATKAIHIELAVDLSTDAFINCLKRFIARRGRCHTIFSDNGTNFVGAKNKLSDLDALVGSSDYNTRISSFLKKDRIQWLFTPPHAPHFGGLWESAVRLTKYHLNRVIGQQRLTFEELYTLLTQIESCLNSRPLSPISSDPNDLTPLTPGHFLIGTALSTLPDHDLKDVKLNRLNRYQLVQQLFQHFWQRWQKEYLHQLQQREKWRSSTNHHLAEGDLVIIKEDNLPPLHWCLGRIAELHQGKDGIVRVVSVRTSDGLYKRPVTKICMLPMQDSSDSE
ncbi:uncharacterized protein LOC143175315 [Nomia melanderi]|uniref:uncharacterized protein LOC143175315 n=1 Tax=Nomia melanderi TaxID=2448451 RepID=UPI003FCD25E0